jgi:hypothetical protein
MGHNYQPKNYHEQGGERTVIGGVISIVDGGEANFEPGGKLLVGGVDFTNRARVMNFDMIEIHVEDLAANADIADRAIMQPPTHRQFVIEAVQLIGRGAAAGIDALNTCVIVLANDAEAIVTATFNDAAPFPAADTPTDLGALHATRKIITSADILKLSVTNGAASNPPAFDINIFGYWEYV